MLTQQAFFGGAQHVSTGTSKGVVFAIGKVVIVETTVGGLFIRTPSARTLKTGGLQGVIVNAGANSFDLQDAGGNVLVSMAAGDAVALYCTDVTTTAGEWIWRAGTANMVPNPPVDFYGYVIGGGDATSHDDVRQWNTVLETWSLRSEIPDYIGGDFYADDSAVCVVGAKGFMAGFNSSSGVGFRKVIAEYDPDVWTRKTDSSNDIRDCGAAAISASAFFFNGQLASQDTMEYATGTDSWTQRTDRTISRVHEATPAYALNSKIVLPEGKASSTPDACYVDTYTVDTFVAKANRPGPNVWKSASTPLGGYGYSYAGYSHDAPPQLVYSAVQRYDETVDSWSSLVNFSAVGGHACFTANGLNFIVGGETEWLTSPISPPPTHKHQTVTDTYVVMDDAPGTYIIGATNHGRGITP